MIVKKDHLIRLEPVGGRSVWFVKAIGRNGSLETTTQRKKARLFAFAAAASEASKIGARFGSQYSVRVEAA